MHGNSMKPYIKKAVLIDNKRIELYWNKQVFRADHENNFKVTLNDSILKLVHWNSNMEWNYGTVYQKESMRTTLCLNEEIDIDNVDHLKIQVIAEVVDLNDNKANYNREYNITYEPYYTQSIKSSSGILIQAGTTVNYKSLISAASIVDLMLKKIPQVAEELVNKNAKISIYGLKENAYDIPEHRMGYLLAIRHVEGFGGDMNNTLSSVSEANLIRLRSGRYATSYPNEMILVHEFGHSIHLVGIDSLKDRTLSNNIKKCYENAKQNNLWPYSYAISNHEEYFATLSTIWFNVMQEGVDGKWDGIRGPVNTRKELEVYDQNAYKLMSSIYSEELISSPWNYSSDHFDIDGNPRIKLRKYNLKSGKFTWDFIK